MKAKPLISFVSIASLLLVQACNSSSGGGGGGVPTPDNGQSSEAGITSLVITVSGVDHTIGFDANREATVNYPYSTTALSNVIVKSIVLSADVTSDHYSGETISLTDGKVIITVTAQDGTEQTYTINLVQAQPNTGADITSLVITVSDTDHTVSFDDARQATINYPYGSAAPATITIKSISLVADATSDYDSGETIILTDDGKAVITVTAQDGTEQTYTIRLVAEENSAAIITSLTLKLIDSTSDSSKSISFDATTTEATIEYQYTQATTPDTIQLTSIDMSAGAIVAIGDATTDGSNNLPVDIAITGANPSVEIMVTAEDGKASKTYTVTISLNKVDPDSLKEITDLDIQLAKTFEPFFFLPKNNITFNANHTATVSHEFAYGASESSLPDRIFISNIAVSAGASANVSIGDLVNMDNSQDSRIVTITVTAKDGSTQAYTLRFNITIAKNTEANINTLVVSVSGTDHTVSFDENEQATINYPYGDSAPTSITIKSIVLSADATSDYATGAAINVATDKVIITVTAQDGSNKAYTIQLVQTAASSEAAITSLIVSVSGVERTISFDANRQAGTYYFYGDSTPDSVKITNIAISAYATADVADDQTVALAGDKITITVTAQDGTVQTYSIALAQTKPSLIKNILDASFDGTSTVPADLSGYDELTKAVLAPYKSGANLIARYVTIEGGAITTQGGTSWADAAPASQLKLILDGISDAGADKVYLLLVASGATADASYDAGSAMKMKNHVAIIGGWDTIGGWGRSGTTVLSGGGSHRVFNNEYLLSSSLGSTALLYGLTIAAGSSTVNGGGMLNSYSSPTLSNITLSANSADYGGGIYNNQSSPSMSNITLSANEATNSGGAIYNDQSSPSMSNITLSANSAVEYGGAIYNFYSSPSMSNITLSANSADYGGGIFNNNSSPSMSNITLSANSASDSGGGIYNNQSSPSMSNITLSANEATSGGGIYNYQSSPSMSNITLSANEATSGGGIYNLESSSSIINATFAGNKATGDGGGIFIQNRKATTIVGSIFWDNTATNGAQIYIRDATGDTITLAYSVIQGGAPANVTTSSNLVTDNPSLADLTTDADSAVATHAISTGSSAINAGIYVRRNGDNYYYSTDNSSWYSDFTSDTATGLIDPTADTVATAEGSIDITATDATGTARSDRPDAGAYEAR